jgi:hypothetical protein
MEKMRLACSWCNKILVLDDFYEIVCEEEGFYFLCSIECKEEWDEFGTIEKGLAWLL